MRIVSLCPSLTELVCDLGAAEDLVLVTKFCVHPAEIVRHIPKVGGTKNPKIDAIVAVAPDLVLLNDEENRLEDAERLEGAGIRCLSTFPRTVPETIDSIRAIGAAIDRVERADALAAEIEAARASSCAEVEGLRRVRYAYLIWRDPFMTVNDDTYIASLLGDAGGTNVFGSAPSRYPEILPADLDASRPDAVLLSTEPYPFGPAHSDEIAKTTGIPRERVVLVDGELLSWHGSRTLRGIGYARDVVGRVRGAQGDPA